jgi:D-aminopeptidase
MIAETNAAIAAAFEAGATEVLVNDSQAPDMAMAYQVSRLIANIARP